jgi:ABC-type transport system substrate-binding protein
MGLGAPAGNAATRIEVYVTKGGIYSSGEVPEIEELYQRQARELDRKKREALLHQIQQITIDRVMFVPVMDYRQLRGVGPRLADAALDTLHLVPYAAYEDLRLKGP